MPTQPNNPLHGITLQAMLEHLVEKLGWEEMGKQVNIRCFTHDPSINSSLKFLRRTPWARTKVEELYLASVRVRKPRPPKSPPKAYPSEKQENVEDDGMDW